MKLRLFLEAGYVVNASTFTFIQEMAGLVTSCMACLASYITIVFPVKTSSFLIVASYNSSIIFQITRSKTGAGFMKGA
jgi:hypothetical protein